MRSTPGAPPPRDRQGRLERSWRRVRDMDRPLALLAGIAFIVQVGVAVMLPLLPLYAVSLGASPMVLGLLTSLFAIANAAGGLATGFLAERFEARRLVAVGIGGYAAANVLIATATAAVPLLAYRTLAGLGGGISFTAERLYLTAIVDRSRLAAANGVLSSAGAAGGVLGPVVGGLLAAVADVRAPFLLVGATSLVGAVAAMFLPRPRSATERAAEATVAARSPSAVSPPTAAPAPDPDGPTAPSAGLRILAILFVVQAGFQASFGAFITTYAPFAAGRLAWSTAEIGIVFALFALGTILVGPWLGRLADRRGRRDVAILSCFLVILFPVAFLLEVPRPILYPVTVIAGAGVTGIEASWFALLGEATDGGRRSRAFGTVSSVANLGIVIGATLAAQLWSQTGDVGLGMVVVGLALVVSAAGLSFLPRDRGSTPTADGASAADAGDQAGDGGRARP